MNANKLYLLIGVILTLFLSGCIEPTADMQLQDYRGEVISMNLNYAMTTKFCQAAGYNTAEQWIIGEEHSGMYGQKVGYNLWGTDGSFNANDRRVHVDCKGNSVEYKSYNIQTVFNWLEKINISINNNSLSNITLDQFCQQQSMNFKERYENKVICYRSFDISKEYAPQEIARWYIANPDV